MSALTTGTNPQNVQMTPGNSGFSLNPLTAAMQAGRVVFGHLTGYEGQRRAHNFSAKQAREQREWQEMMSNTAHQRAVKDMRAAGLNPILAAGGAHQASTPSGAAPSGSSATPSNALMSALSVLPEIALKLSSAKQADSQAELAATQAGDIAKTQEWRIEHLRTQMYNLDADTAMKYDLAKKLAAETSLTHEQAKAMVFANFGNLTEAEFHQNSGEIYRWYQKWVLPLFQGSGTKIVPKGK